MMPYQDLTIEDFLNYWQGCIAFKLDNDDHGIAGARVTPYCIDRVERDDDGDFTGDSIEDTECILSGACMGTSSTSTHTMELFDSPLWITHRFQLGYVRMRDDKLLRITAEPNNRRMYKGTSMPMARRLPLLDSDDQTHPCNTPMGQADATLYGHQGPSMDMEAAVRGIADVLAIGHPACVRRIVPKSVACERSKKVIKDMLLGHDAPRVVVPDFSTALVGHRSITNEATVLTNGQVVGKLRVANNGELVLSAYVTKYDSKQVRKQAREALTSRALSMYADTVEWVL